jgi:hypothetical protein
MSGAALHRRQTAGLLHQARLAAGEDLELLTGADWSPTFLGEVKRHRSGNIVADRLTYPRKTLVVDDNCKSSAVPHVLDVIAVSHFYSSLHLVQLGFSPRKAA